MEEKKEKLDIRGHFVASTGEYVDYHIYEPDKKREEKTPKEFAEDLTEAVLESAIGAGKNVISKRFEMLESELRLEKASLHIVKTNMECILILCRRAMEAGKLDKEVYKEISLIKTDGQNDNYIPENYKQ